ncbi:methionyl-tRNA formyltransferase [Mesonia aquimarina]|uniref:methionyl-tRNA formyltransferase n=1 Tax=Mesonia aquimarina TaxID=1504967 RepID=UPI000EF62DE6|nr:formyltransferase family protein [Mesonia aquimarina]
MKLGILCSGGLGYSTLVKLVDKYPVNFVFTDSKSISIIELCRNNSIPVFIGNPRKGKAKKFIKENTCNVLISINYLFIIEQDVINMGTDLTFNIHGSLLPKYRGRTPHVWAIINDEKQTGITAHVIDEGCDTGSIIEQVVIPIDIKDTGNDVLVKYHKHYVPLIEKVIAKYKEGTITFKSQKEDEATYFGKRTPSDGQINWNWQRKRIFNWVRAQANPYPGAYTFYGDMRLTIDEVSLSNYGFDYSMENGRILSTTPLLVKTPNGVLEVISMRGNIKLKKGALLI